MNKLTLRLKTLLDELGSCKTFADVGCDHGYIAENMLKYKEEKAGYESQINAVKFFDIKRNLEKAHENILELLSFYPFQEG